MLHRCLVLLINVIGERKIYIQRVALREFFQFPGGPFCPCTELTQNCFCLKSLWFGDKCSQMSYDDFLHWPTSPIIFLYSIKENYLLSAGNKTKDLGFKFVPTLYSLAHVDVIT